MVTELINTAENNFIPEIKEVTSIIPSNTHSFLNMVKNPEEVIETEIIPSSINEKVKRSPFIEANTEVATLYQLQNECSTAIFAKDNELTVAHQDFIRATQECVFEVFKNEIILEPDIRVSHIIKGRVPEALRKPVNELLPHEKTMYWERLAFCVEIPSITKQVGGNTLTLCVGGVRALNHQNLYSKKSAERFKVFIGFRNLVCLNTCISTDGFLSDVKVLSIDELKKHIIQLLTSYNMENHISDMQSFENQYLTETQFCQILGRGRLYQHLPKNVKAIIPELQFNDGQLNAMAKAYFEDENFSKDSEGNISLWRMYNLFTGANKSSYIDSFLDKGLNAFEFTQGIQKALIGSGDYHWFLS